MSGKGGISLITFHLNNQLFGIDVQPVNEVVPLPEITPLGDQSSSGAGTVRGVFNLRGTIVPVVDLKFELGLTVGPYALSHKMIILRHDQVLFGLIVDSLDSIVNLSDDDMALTPEISYGIPKRYLRSVGKTPEGLIIILKTEELLDSYWQ